MNNKKGISLIVLIVTIIVIIILAAAVILTLNQNNPIDSSRVAQLADNRASINSAIQLYYGKHMAATQGKYDANQIFTQTGVKAEDKTLIGTALVGGNETTNKYVLTANNVKDLLDVTLPDIANASWYLDVDSGLVYLGYADYSKIPAWMFTDSKKTEMDETLNGFVRVVTVAEKTDSTTNKKTTTTTMQTYKEATADAGSTTP